MILPITRWTLRQRRTSTIWWSVAVSAFILLNMVFYPSFKDQAAELEKTFENLPSNAVQFLGGSTDFFSPVGFLNSQVFFIMLPMLLGILAVGLGASLLAREEQDGTIETLLARPVSRSNVLASKAMAGVIILAIVTICAGIATIVSGKAVGLSVSAWTITTGYLVCFILCLCFGAISFLLTALGKARGAAIGVGALAALGGYILTSLAGTVDWLGSVAKLTPFYYYQPEALLRGAYDWSNLLYYGVIIVVCATASWYVFNHRDIDS